MLSTLLYFRDEYVAHVERKECPAGMCAHLTAYRIVQDRCDGCHLCTRACPVEAITGRPKQVHEIVQDRCISCGACFDACDKDAIGFEPKTKGDTHAHAGH